MGKVKRLSSHVANQIAAGEVVERPLAIVKELVENALDANARKIEIAFERGGKQSIRVTDDGDGMDAEDAGLALQRHATSKITDSEDILSIHSFGFRGEALPSIASVSEFSLKTREHSADSGVELNVGSSGEIHQRVCGMSPGTEVLAKNLFYNVPARRKFLKSDRTESAHIIQMSRLLAIANPDVAFTLIEDGREQFRSPLCENVRDRVGEIIGARRLRDYLDLDFSFDGYRLSGLIGKPDTGRSTRAEMIFFVNKRPVDSRLLSYATIESYHPHLPRGRYPAVYLMLEVPPSQVDVNVHPAKREVRFKDEGYIRRLVMESLSEALEAQESAPLKKATPVSSQQKTVLPIGIPKPAVRPVFKPEKPQPPSAPPVPLIKKKETAPPAKGLGEADNVPQQEVSSAAALDQSRSNSSRFIGDLRGDFGLFENADGLLIINPRAAAERILHDEVLQQLELEKVKLQELIFPMLLEFSPLDGAVISESLDLIQSLGLGVENFGRNMYRMIHYPSWFDDSEAEQFLRDLVQKIREKGIQPKMENLYSEVARIVVFRAKGRMLPRSAEEWEKLAAELFLSSNPLQDPRGRRIVREIRHAEFQSYFS